MMCRTGEDGRASAVPSSGLRGRRVAPKERAASGDELVSEGMPTMTACNANIKDRAPKVLTFLD